MKMRIFRGGAIFCSGVLILFEPGVPLSAIIPVPANSGKAIVHQDLRPVNASGQVANGFAMPVPAPGKYLHTDRMGQG